MSIDLSGEKIILEKTTTQVMLFSKENILNCQRCIFFNNKMCTWQMDPRVPEKNYCLFSRTGAILYVNKDYCEDDLNKIDDCKCADNKPKRERSSTIRPTAWSISCHLCGETLNAFGVKQQVINYWNKLFGSKKLWSEDDE
jgi:hypothetical protein